MQSLSTFIRISGAFSEAKTSVLINDCERNNAFWEESKRYEVKANKCALFQI